MIVCIVGGIFNKPAKYQAKHAYTPESVLANGLRNRGIDVVTVGHEAFRTSDRFDIVHVHHLGKGALRASVDKKKSYLVFTGHNGQMLCNYERSIIRIIAFRFVLKRCHAVIALSQREREYLCNYLSEDRITIIPNGIPTDLFRLPDEKKKREKSGINILYVGQLIPLKGVEVLLKAFQRLILKWDVSLTLVYQTASLEDKIKNLAKSMNIEQRINYKGFLSAPQLAELYREVDLLVLPSYAESLPSVVTEAFLTGLPVVTSSVGGLPEQVGPYGKLVPPGDVTALASGIDSVLSDLPKWKTKEKEIRDYALNKFKVDNMITSHIKLYQNIMDGNIEPVSSYTGLDFIIKGGLEVLW